VPAWGDRSAGRRPLYRGREGPRLSRLARWLVPPTAALCALTAAGCSYRLSSLIPRNDAGTETTGSIGRPGNPPKQEADATLPPELDLAYARAAAADVLSRGGRDSSVPWENPQTGAGGNITPLAVSYNEGGSTCRDFLASYVHGEAEAWLKGEACRTGGGKWEVKSLTPLKRG